MVEPKVILAVAAVVIIIILVLLLSSDPTCPKGGVLSKSTTGGKHYCKFDRADSPGNDIGSVSPATVRAKCDADSNCKGFNSAGWYKNTIRDPSRFESAGADFYVKM
jgi:hypothetical protein